VGPAPVAQRI